MSEVHQISIDDELNNISKPPVTQEQPVILTGSNIPLVANNPIKIGSVPYTAFRVNSTYYGQPISNVLKRNARQRTFIFVNTSDVTITSLTFDLCDSSLSSLGFTSSQPSTSLSSALNPNFSNYATSEQFPELSGHVDSFEVNLTIGGVTPTKGGLDIYLVELM